MGFRKYLRKSFSNYADRNNVAASVLDDASAGNPTVSLCRPHLLQPLFVACGVFYQPMESRCQFSQYDAPLVYPLPMELPSRIRVCDSELLFAGKANDASRPSAGSPSYAGSPRSYVSPCSEHRSSHALKPLRAGRWPALSGFNVAYSSFTPSTNAFSLRERLG